MKPTGQLPALTGVRILAAAGVFLSHVTIPEFVPGIARTFMTSGYNGVTLFFILSGFVLAWSWGDRILPLRASTLWSFYVARFARIYPVYLFALLIVILPWALSGGFTELMFLHALALQPWSSHLDRAYSFNGPGWSIGVEVFLYACFPLVFLFLAKLRKTKVLLLAMALAVVLASFGLAWWFIATGRADLPWTDAQSAHRWLYRIPVTRLGDFILGAVAALLVQGFKAPRWLPMAAQVAGGAGIIVLMCNSSLLYTAWSWDAAYMVPAVLLLWGLAAGTKTPIASALSTRSMVLMGQASYAFYLIHMPLLAAWPLVTSTPAAWLSSVAIHFVVIMFAAIGIHLYLEEPVRAWLTRTLAPRKRAAIAAST